jgi:hypothetical protein
MSRIASVLGIGFSILLSLAGLGGFVWLLVREMNVFWLVLAPVIFAVYQIPAAVVYALWKRKYGKKTLPSSPVASDLDKRPTNPE